MGLVPSGLRGAPDKCEEPIETAALRSAATLPIHELVKWLRKRPEIKRLDLEVTGGIRLSRKLVLNGLTEDEMHHWKTGNSVKLIPFYDPKKALAEVLEMGFYFWD